MLDHNNSIGPIANRFSPQPKVWDIVGQSVDHCPTTKEVLECSGLNFKVQKLPNTRHYPSGKSEVSKESFFTYRTDTDQKLADHVGKKYSVVQNSDAFAFFDHLAGKDGVFYQTAGCMGGGRQVFVTAKLPDYIRIGQSDDVIEEYILLSTTHDGSGAIMAALTPIRLQCYNALNCALQNASISIRIPHTLNALKRLENAHKLMGIVNTSSKEMEQTFTAWSKLRITDRQVKNLIEQAMASKETLALLKEGKYIDLPIAFKRTCETVFEYYADAPSQQLETTKGTVFGAYNAITGYFQNVKTYSTPENKMNSIFFDGQAHATAQKASTLCENFAQFGAQALILN